MEVTFPLSLHKVDIYFQTDQKEPLLDKKSSSQFLEARQSSTQLTAVVLMRGALSSTTNRKTIENIIQERKTAKKFDRNRKPHAKPYSSDKWSMEEKPEPKPENHIGYQLWKPVSIFNENQKLNAK